MQQRKVDENGSPKVIINGPRRVANYSTRIYKTTGVSIVKDNLMGGLAHAIYGSIIVIALLNFGPNA